MADGTATASQIARLLDEGMETLRWCRQHLGERRATERLRELQITLAALSLALDYEMDGQSAKALQALERADWRVRARMPFDPHNFTGGEIFDH